MKPEVVAALAALKEGLAHLDSYQPVPDDDSPILVDFADSLHELATNSGQFSVGHLRTIAAHLGDI